MNAIASWAVKPPTETSAWARVLADSVNPAGIRLVTCELIIWREMLAELNTHRAFCLAGDALLEFDLPAGRSRNSGHRRVFKMRLDEFVDKWHNGAAPRRSKTKSDGSSSFNRQPVKERLAGMRIRQLDETTGLVQTSHVVDCFVSGVKRVYEVRAGKHRVAGSADHRIFTPTGWRTIGELAPGDEIVVQRRGKQDQDVLDPIRLKKIGGQWRSAWQRIKRAELVEKHGGCVRCQSTDDLHVHHLVPVHVAPELAFDDSNVTLLCGDCHHDEHRIQGWQGGTYLYGDTAVVDEVVFRGHEMTYDLEIDGKYPNFVANGLVVHNSRNSASMHAIPVEKILAQVMDNPFIPRRFPINRPGMSATEYIEPDHPGYPELVNTWLSARDTAVEDVRLLLMQNVHKQIANRLLGPWMWHTVIVSATEWENFFQLRASADTAQPEIYDAAIAIMEAMGASTPKPLVEGQWHLPLVGDEEQHALGLKKAVRVCCARVAAVSYNRHDADSGLLKELVRFDTLKANRHMSPFEHAAMVPTWPSGFLNDGVQSRLALTERFGNFQGWQQARWFIERDLDLPV